MKKNMLFMLLPVLMAISAGTALPTAVFASEDNSKNAKALAPVDETLYWGYNSDTKVFYFSKTDTAITEEGVTPYSFDSTIAYGAAYKPWDYVSIGIKTDLTKIKILNDITPGETSGWFRGMFSLAEIDGIEKLNTSNVTDMSVMFNGCYALEDIDLSHFDTSNVTDMGAMFWECTGLKSVDLSSFDTSNVTDMCEMFSECEVLESLDLSNFNTSKVTKMLEMFKGCYVLETLDISNFDTSNVMCFGQMFYNCKALKSLDLSNFKVCIPTGEASVYGLIEMFAGCLQLTELDLSGFDTSNATNMRGMFDTCRALKSVNLSSFDTSNVTDMDYMFKNCTSLTSLDLSNFDCSKVESGELFKLTPPVASNKYTLASLKTPKNLKVDMKVPGINSSSYWYKADTLDVYDNAYLPKDSSNSVTLAAGVLADSWSSLQDAITTSSGTPTEPADKITPIILKNDLVAPTEGGSSITIPNGKNVSINLNGNVLNANGRSFSAINVIEGGKLTIIDTMPTAEHYFTVGDDGLWTLTNTKSDTTKTVLGGVITGANVSSNNGGGVKNDGTFNMNGGNICGNKATNGGGVYNHGVFNMSANSAILGNTADMGGGVSFTGTFNMSENSQISNNTAISNGGGVYTMSSTAQFVMSDNSKIADNIAKKAGGGVYLGNGSFTMNGGEITGNNSTNGSSGLFGGGVFSNSSSAILGGKAKITGNTAGADDAKIANNFELCHGKFITLGTKTASDEGNGVKAPTGDFKVGVTMKSAGKFTTNGKEDDTKYFSSDNEYYEVKYNADVYLELTPIPMPSPVMSPTSGYATSVTLTAEEGTIYYTTNGSEPTASSTKYMGSPIPVTSDNFVIKAIAIDTVNSRKSEVVTGIFTNVIKCTVNINAVNGTVDVEELTNIVFDTAYSINANKLTIGDTEITATADEGFEFNCWKIGDTPAAASGSIRSNLTFTAVFSNHDLVKVDGTPATEDHDGFKDAYKCNLCGKYFEDEAGTKLIGDEAAYNAWKLAEGKIPALDPQKENGLSGGAIAGIVIGSVFGLLIIAFVVLYILWKRKNLNVPILSKVLTPAFRFINKLFFKTKLNDVEAKEAENKAMKE